MATTVTPTTLKSKARGVFDAVSDADVQDAIDEAVRYISEANWGSRYDDGVFYLACHIVTEMEMIVAAAADGGEAATGGAVPAGPVSSEALLTWRATYAVPQGDVFNDAFATTTWGRAYLARARLVFSNRVL